MKNSVSLPVQCQKIGLFMRCLRPAGVHSRSRVGAVAQQMNGVGCRSGAVFLPCRSMATAWRKAKSGVPGPLGYGPVLGAQRVEEGTEAVVVEFMHQGEQLPDLSRRETFTGKPVQVVSRQVRDQAALVFAKGHHSSHQQLQQFRVADHLAQERRQAAQSRVSRWPRGA